MNCGWNATREEVESRAAAALLEAGIAVDTHTVPKAQRDTDCSQVMLTFKKAEDLRMARLKVAVLEKTQPGSNRQMWLDAQKTRSNFAQHACWVAPSLLSRGYWTRRPGTS